MLLCHELRLLGLVPVLNMTSPWIRPLRPQLANFTDDTQESRLGRRPQPFSTVPLHGQLATQGLGNRLGLLVKRRELADSRSARAVMTRNASGCWPSFFFLLRPMCGLAPSGVR